ncbi:hypothetical protein ACOMHN_013756 [Nucella lapillus]
MPLAHNPLRLPMPPIAQQQQMQQAQQQQQAAQVATTLDSYVTGQMQGMGGGGSPANNPNLLTRTNQNLITVPIQDEAESYNTSRGGRESERPPYTGPPPSIPSHMPPTAAPPASYGTPPPPPHLGMPPPGVRQPFNPQAGLVGVGGRVPLSSAPLVQAVAHLTHALSQRAHLAGNPPPQQRLSLPIQAGTGVPPVSTPSRYPHGAQQPFSSNSPMQHWGNAPPPPPRQGQNQPPPQRPPPPMDNNNYRQYY